MFCTTFSYDIRNTKYIKRNIRPVPIKVRKTSLKMFLRVENHLQNLKDFLSGFILTNSITWLVNMKSRSLIDPLSVESNLDSKYLRLEFLILIIYDLVLWIRDILQPSTCHFSLAWNKIEICWAKSVGLKWLGFKNIRRTIYIWPFAATLKSKAADVNI